MAGGSKPRKARDYRAEYSKRIERALEKGKSRQQARGHKAHEHIERRERERAQFGLSSQEVTAIRHWYARLNPGGHKEIPTEEDVIEFARTKGYADFKVYRDTWNAARQTYLREVKRGDYASRGELYLVMLTDMAGVMPPGDERWLYYH